MREAPGARPAGRVGARRREWRQWLLATAAAGLLFGLWPALDLRLAALFFDPRAGQGPAGFSAATQPLVLAVYLAVPWLGRGAALLCLWAWWQRRRRLRAARSSTGVAPATTTAAATVTAMARRWQGRAAMLGALLLLGVGVAVHVVLKDQWGRPRPEQVQAFGGDKVFQPWWQPSGECARNCAFVSGHAATGYALMGLGLLAAPARRRRWLAAGWAAGGAIGLVRMVQGGHFASDVLGAGLVTWGVGLALRRWVLWRRLRRWQRRPLA